MKNSEKVQQLKELGYSDEYLNKLTDPNYEYVRFTWDDLLYLEKLVGKKFQSAYEGEQKIIRVDPWIVDCTLYLEGGVTHVQKINNELVCGRSKIPLNQKIKD